MHLIDLLLNFQLIITPTETCLKPRLTFHSSSRFTKAFWGRFDTDKSIRYSIVPSLLLLASDTPFSISKQPSPNQTWTRRSAVLTLPHSEKKCALNVTGTAYPVTFKGTASVSS